MKKLLIIFIFAAIFTQQSKAEANDDCLQTCNISHIQCIGQQEKFNDYMIRKQCEGQRSVCHKQCKVLNSDFDVQDQIMNNILKAKYDDDDFGCQDNCKKSMFKCQINCKTQGPKCNLDCEVKYRTCLSVTCQQ